jgi:hypothetical protein
VSRGKKAVFAALAGLAPALVAEMLALGLAGAGHGWAAPWLYGLGLFLAYPATFAILTLEPRRPLPLGLLLLAGLAADAALAFDTLETEWPRFEQIFAIGPIFTAFWILLWLAWQAAALAALLTPPAAGDDPE